MLVTSMLAPALYASNDVVQHAVATQADAVDALDAMQAGVTAQDAFGERPLPYRSWGAVQVAVYECLFAGNYDVEDAIYELHTEIDPATAGETVSGQTAIGLSFELAPEFVTSVPNSVDLWGDATGQSLSDVNANICVVYGTISTDLCSLNVACAVWQYDTQDGGRGRFLLVVDIISVSLLDDLRAWQVSQAEGDAYDDFGLPYQTCEQAFAHADRLYGIAMDAAKAAMDDCVIDAMLEFGGGLAGCTSLALGLTLFSAGAGGIAGLLTLLTCAAGLHAKQLNDLRKCNNAYQNAASTARATRQARRDAARSVFGEDCPDDPA